MAGVCKTPKVGAAVGSCAKAWSWGAKSDLRWGRDLAADVEAFDGEGRHPLPPNSPTFSTLVDRWLGSGRFNGYPAAGRADSLVEGTSDEADLNPL